MYSDTYKFYLTLKHLISFLIGTQFNNKDILNNDIKMSITVKQTLVIVQYFSMHILL